MTQNIPTWQRTLQRFLMMRPVTSFLAPILCHADTLLLRLSSGRLDFSRAAGLPVIELITVGAKTGELRTLPLSGCPDGKKIILVASNFGRERNPAWYYNLKANPECVVKKKGRSGTYIAREAEGEERERYWNLAVSYYIGFEAYRQRASHRKTPVMVLEPEPQINTDKRG